MELATSAAGEHDHHPNRIPGVIFRQSPRFRITHFCSRAVKIHLSQAVTVPFSDGQQLGNKPEQSFSTATPLKNWPPNPYATTTIRSEGYLIHGARATIQWADKRDTRRSRRAHHRNYSRRLPASPNGRRSLRRFRRPRRLHPNLERRSTDLLNRWQDKPNRAIPIHERTCGRARSDRATKDALQVWAHAHGGISMAGPRGIDHFLNHLKELEDEYVVIGGGAAALLMSQEGLEFRATHDVAFSSSTPLQTSVSRPALIAKCRSESPRVNKLTKRISRNTGTIFYASPSPFAGDPVLEGLL